MAVNEKRINLHIGNIPEKITMKWKRRYSESFVAACRYASYAANSTEIVTVVALVCIRRLPM